MFSYVSDQFWRINEPFHNLMGSGNLIIQLLIFGMLIMSMGYKRKGNLKGHGNMMFLAFITNFVSFALVMVTGFIYFHVSKPLSLSYKLSIVHGLIGGSAMLSSLSILLHWLIRGSNSKYCTVKKTQMKVTYILWSMALLLGLFVWYMDVIMDI